MRKRNFNYLKKLDKELKESAEAHGIEVEELMLMVDDMFHDIRKLIVSPKLPIITIGRFGTFRPSKKRIRYLITRFIRIVREIKRENSGDPTQVIADFYKKIERYWAVRQRFYAEKRGIRTWLCWRDLPDDLEGWQECHKARHDNCIKCREDLREKESQTEDSMRETS